MLKIRPEQIREFQPQAENAFVERVAVYLKVNHPDELVRLPHGESKLGELPKEVLREMVSGGINRARAHGLEWKSNLLSFVVLMVIGAPNFDEHKKCAAFLRAEIISTEKRLEKMMEQMTDEDWEEIEANYSPGAWNVPKTAAATEAA